MDEVKKAMAEQENVINPTTPEAAVATFSREQARYGEVVRKAGVTLD